MRQVLLGAMYRSHYLDEPVGNRVRRESRRSGGAGRDAAVVNLDEVGDVVGDFLCHRPQCLSASVPQ